VSTEQLRAEMVERMMAGGSLRSRPWIAAFTGVPRHSFLSRFFRQSEDLSGWEAVSAGDPGAMELIYDGGTWVTQLDNDPYRWQTARSSDKPISGTPTSSSTAPGLMALMLEALDVHDGHQILEIGTGSGYNAALLAHRLGSALVTTVEVDPDVAEAARGSLHAAGWTPSLAVADGSAGHPERAPYDRLIATCSTPTIPPAWLAQVRPGGLILTSLYRDLGGGPLVLLRVQGDGQAEGRFLPDYGGFMPVRTHPPADAPQRLTAALAAHTADDRRGTTLAADVLDDPDFGMVAALRLPGVASIGFTPEDSDGPQRWLLAADGSWACLQETTGSVSQHGTRRLWDEIENAHQQWTQLGTASRDRLGLTITPTGEHRFWLDTATQVWWDHPADLAGVQALPQPAHDLVEPVAGAVGDVSGAQLADVTAPPRRR
jgi:protein-L-isoaspartate(D-aspartate) O-methyltransferase